MGLSGYFKKDTSSYLRTTDVLLGLGFNSFKTLPLKQKFCINAFGKWEEEEIQKCLFG